MNVRSPAACIVLSLCAVQPALAFPPYRSTDADTADRGALELRVGLVRVERLDSGTRRAAPLMRANLGVGERFELITELEHVRGSGHTLDEGALGFKWAQGRQPFSIGVETLALLPVESGQGGVGIESQVLATRKLADWQVHFNVGGFHDPRAQAARAERGWRASVLAELPRGRLRPGLELFAKRARSEPAHVQAGIGLIAQLERLEIRAGLHFGLTDEAPDVAASIWLARSWRVIARQSPRRASGDPNAETGSIASPRTRMHTRIIRSRAFPDGATRARSSDHATLDQRDHSGACRPAPTWWSSRRCSRSSGASSDSIISSTA